jgi:hypothetical protein
MYLTGGISEVITILLLLGGLAYVLIRATIGIALVILMIILNNVCWLYEKVSGKKTPLPILKFLYHLDEFTAKLAAN